MRKKEAYFSLSAYLRIDSRRVLTLNICKASVLRSCERSLQRKHCQFETVIAQNYTYCLSLTKAPVASFSRVSTRFLKVDCYVDRVADCLDSPDVLVAGHLVSQELPHQVSLGGDRAIHQKPVLKALKNWTNLNVGNFDFFHFSAEIFMKVEQFFQSQPWKEMQGKYVVLRELFLVVK